VANHGSLAIAAGQPSPGPAPRAGLPPLRRDRSVLGWSIAQGISEIGDEIWFVALAYAAARLGSPSLAGMVLACAAIPRALLMLVGGAMTDRFDARRVMLISDIGRMLVLVGALAVLAMAGTSAAVLIGVGLLFGVADAFYGPASAAYPRQLRPLGDMTQLAGIRQMINRGATLCGPPLGGLMVAGVGLGGAMAVDAFSFAVIALVLVMVRPRWPRKRASGGSVRADIGNGMSYLRRTSRVRDLAMALSGMNVFVTPVVTVGLAVRTVDAGWGPVALGALTACIGAGAVLGTMVAIRLRPRRPVFVALLFLLAQGVSLGVVGFGSFAAVLVAMVAVGGTAGLASPMLVGAFQATVDDEYVGRVGSILSLTDDGLAPLALVGFGALAAVAGLAVACVVSGTCFLLLIGIALARPHIRALRSDGSLDQA
jgi:MFS family permease